MAREQELIAEVRQPYPPRYELTQSTHADVLVDIVVEFLRQTFSRHPLYTYVRREDSNGPDFELTKIVIVDKYTEDALLLPTVTMGIDSIQTQWVQFSQSPFLTVLKPQMNLDGTIKRDAQGVALPSHYEYVGMYNSSLTLQVNASSTLEREELVNLLQVIFAESGRDTLYMRGVFVKTVNAGGQSEIEYRNDYIFQQTVTIDAMSEWRRIIPVGEALESIGFLMDVTEGGVQAPPAPPTTAPTTADTVVPVFNLESSPFVIDPTSNQPTAVNFILSATTDAAPVALMFNSTTWLPTSFWRTVLSDTLIPFANFADPTVPGSINIPASSAVYLQEAGKAILQAMVARTMATTQGRRLTDGTVVIGDTFIYSDGKVDLRNFQKEHLYPQSPEQPLLYNITVEADNTVVMRLSKRNISLVAKNVILDAYGNTTGGDLYKRYASDGSNDVQVSTNETVLLDGTDYSNMSAVDLLMILIYGEQPYRFSLSFLTARIDELLVKLADTNLVIAFRLAKIASITSIKDLLIQRSETYLLRRPAGL